MAIRAMLLVSFLLHVVDIVFLRILYELSRMSPDFVHIVFFFVLELGTNCLIRFHIPEFSMNGFFREVSSCCIHSIIFEVCN